MYTYGEKGTYRVKAYDPKDVAATFKKCADTLEAVYYTNEKLKKIIEHLAGRSDVSDNAKLFILDALKGKKGTH